MDPEAKGGMPSARPTRWRVRLRLLVIAATAVLAVSELVNLARCWGVGPVFWQGNGRLFLTRSAGFVCRTLEAPQRSRVPALAFSDAGVLWYSVSASGEWEIRLLDQAGQLQRYGLGDVQQRYGLSMVQRIRPAGAVVWLIAGVTTKPGQPRRPAVFRVDLESCTYDLVSQAIDAASDREGRKRVVLLEDGGLCTYGYRGLPLGCPTEDVLAMDADLDAGVLLLWERAANESTSPWPPPCVVVDFRADQVSRAVVHWSVRCDPISHEWWAESTLIPGAPFCTVYGRALRSRRHVWTWGGLHGAVGRADRPREALLEAVVRLDEHRLAQVAVRPIALAQRERNMPGGGRGQISNR